MAMRDETGLALLTVAEMGRVDAAAIAGGTPGATLMERAGRAVADAVARRARAGDRVLVLCGPGGNGGDGFVAARLLRQRGLAVTLALAGEPSALTGDPAAMAALWTGPVLPIAAVAPAEHALIVDALYGAGLNRPIAGEAAALVEAVIASGRPVVSVDVPSGLSGDTGQATGPVLRAAETVTFVRLKPGHLLQPGRSLCGVLTLADLGIAPETVAAAVGYAAASWRNDPALWRDGLPRHALDIHKYRRGAVLVVAGGLEGVGAPRLAARAALRIGAGLATIACRPEALSAHAARGPDALMVRSILDQSALDRLLAEPRLSSVVIGPALGLDATARAAVAAALRCCAPAVFDADALTILAQRGHALRHAIERRGAPAVLTPHEGEFARLFGAEPWFADARSKLDRARLAARHSGAVVILKGPDSVIAAPDGRAAINLTGAPALATAGSGDVLAGVVAGLLAQGMPAFEAACAAVHLHGAAGAALGRGLIADDLPEALPGQLEAALREGD